MTDALRALHDFQYSPWKQGRVWPYGQSNSLTGHARINVGVAPTYFVQEDTIYPSFTAVASNGKPPYVYTASGLPPGVTINPVTGIVSGIPLLSQTDDELFGAIFIRATDSTGRFGESRPFSIYVQANATVWGALGNEYIITNDGRVIDLMYMPAIAVESTANYISSAIATDPADTPIVTDGNLYILADGVPPPPNPTTEIYTENNSYITVETIDDTGPTVLVYPSITGGSAVGSTLTAQIGSWANFALPGGFSFQWYANQVAIPGATSLSFTTTNAQIGQILTMIATVTSAQGIYNSVTPPFGPIHS